MYTSIKTNNLSIPHGEITVFVESNCCGKSTQPHSIFHLPKPSDRRGHTVA